MSNVRDVYKWYMIGSLTGAVTFKKVTKVFNNVLKVNNIS